MSSRPLLILVLIAALLVGLVVAHPVQAAHKNHAFSACQHIGIPRAHEHAGRAIRACIEARMANRKGPFGLRGVSLVGRAAGWCAGQAIVNPAAARGVAVDAGPPPDTDCIEARVAWLRDAGYRDVFWGVDGPHGVK